MIASPTEHLPEPAHEGACACGQHHSHVQVQFIQSGLGIVFVLNSFLLNWLFAHNETVAAFSAMAGAVILGFPIVRVAIKDLRRGGLNTNVLVALAVLALFSAGHYQEAGIVSFFMLLGQIIESRTARSRTHSARGLAHSTTLRAVAGPKMRFRAQRPGARLSCAAFAPARPPQLLHPPKPWSGSGLWCASAIFPERRHSCRPGLELGPGPTRKSALLFRQVQVLGKSQMRPGLFGPGFSACAAGKRWRKLSSNNRL